MTGLVEEALNNESHTTFGLRGKRCHAAAQYRNLIYQIPQGGWFWVGVALLLLALTVNDIRTTPALQVLNRRTLSDYALGIVPGAISYLFPSWSVMQLVIAVPTLLIFILVIRQDRSTWDILSDALAWLRNRTGANAG